MTQMDLATASALLNEAMREHVRKNRLLFLVQAGVMVATGVVAVIFPVLASVAFVWVLGWLLVATGIVQAVGLFGARNHPSFWLQLIPAVLAIAVGVLLLRNIGPGLLVISLLLVVHFLVDGMSRIILALTVRPLENWVWVLASGVLGILLAVVLFGSLPVGALWLIGLLLGVHLIAEGAALGALAWTSGRTEG